MKVNLSQTQEQEAEAKIDECPHHYRVRAWYDRPHGPLEKHEITAHAGGHDTHTHIPGVYQTWLNMVDR